MIKQIQHVPEIQKVQLELLVDYSVLMSRFIAYIGISILF